MYRSVSDSVDFEPVAAANYERVVGVHPARITQHFNETGGFFGGQSDVYSTDALVLQIRRGFVFASVDEWKNISRGRD
jgi:hypothetical protein